MPDNLARKQAVLEFIAERDEQYQQDFKRYREAEKRFLKLEEELDPKARDIIWDYIMSCEAVSGRMLQIACEYVDFSGHTIKL